MVLAGLDFWCDNYGLCLANQAQAKNEGCRAMVLGNCQCLGVLQFWIMVGQRPTHMLAGCACEDYLDIYLLTVYCLRPWACVYNVVIGFDMDVQPLVTHNAA